MSDSGSSGSMLQRLLAEHRRAEADNPGRSDSFDPGLLYGDNNNKSEISQGGNDGRWCSEDETVLGQPDCVSLRANVHPTTPRSDAGLAARLDALCRSTLEKSVENSTKTFLGKQLFSANERNEGDRMLNKATTPSDVLAEKSSQTATKPRLGSEILAKYRREIQQSGLGVDRWGHRLPPPSYQEAQFEAEHMRASETSKREVLVSPRRRIQQEDNSIWIHGNATSDSFQKNLQPSMQINGHPKSNSGGDEYLYTDQLRRNNQRRGYRGRKNAAGVARSRSLHNKSDEATSTRLRSLEEQKCSDSENIALQLPEGSEVISGAGVPSSGASAQGSPQTQHRTSKSAPLQVSGKLSTPELRRYSVQCGSMQSLQEVDARDPGQGTGEPGSQGNYISIVTKQTSEIEKQPSVMPQTPTASQIAYMRGSSGMHGGPSGTYYPGMSHSNHGIVGQGQSNTTSSGNLTPLRTVPSAPASMRAPPPPYPTRMMAMEQGMGAAEENNGAYVAHPQRPKSLELGHFSKKKGNGSNINALNSPAGLTSPTGGFSSQLRGTAFYGATIEGSAYNQQNAQLYNNGGHFNNQSSHSLQNGSGSCYLHRSGSGSNVRNIAMATPSSSSSSTATAVGTPNFSDAPSFAEAALRSPMANYSMHGIAPHNTHGQNYVADNYANGSSSGVSKSDSINSSSSTTSSGGTRGGFARRRKRNSSSKSSYGNTSSSGSSNGGSRPNSNADLTDNLEVENEKLRNKLELAMKKLRRFEEIEIELKMINQSHQALRLSANKQEMLEKEMRNALHAKLQRVEKDKVACENQVLSLTEQLKTITMTSSRDDSNCASRGSNLIEIYEAENRKMAERERQVQEELEECKERISEQEGDIANLRSRLDSANKTVEILKAKFIQSSSVDAYTEQLSEHLKSLQKIVNERIEVEAEIRNQLRRQLGQRPLKSTSSNDEGISEMDADLSASNLSSDIYSSRETQMLGAQAEMLKWQHRYLEQGIILQIQGNGSGKDETTPLHKALKNHRHSVSDPGFDKLSLRKSLLPLLNNEQSNKHSNSSNRGFENAQHGTDLERDNLLQLCVNKSGDDRKGYEDTATTFAYSTSIGNPLPGSRTECACQTPTKNYVIDETGQVQSSSLCEKTEANNVVSTSDCGSQTGAATTNTPSEGYHSQQSSGSPTPNTERSSIHFPTQSDSGYSPIREVQTSSFRRNRSADILTSFNA